MLEACYIRVEVKKRELISRTDLAIEMVRRGVPVILGEVYSSDELEKIGVDQGYLFGKCAQPDTLSKFRPLLDLGWTFGALDEEGLLPDTLSHSQPKGSQPKVQRRSKTFFSSVRLRRTPLKISLGIKSPSVCLATPERTCGRRTATIFTTRSYEK